MARMLMKQSMSRKHIMTDPMGTYELQPLALEKAVYLYHRYYVSQGNIGLAPAHKG